MLKLQIQVFILAFFVVGEACMTLVYLYNEKPTQALIAFCLLAVMYPFFSKAALRAIRRESKSRSKDA